MDYLALDIGNVSIRLNLPGLLCRLQLTELPEAWKELQRQMECGELPDEEFFELVYSSLPQECQISSASELRREFLRVLDGPVSGMPELVADLPARGVQPVFFSDISDTHLQETRRLFPGAEQLEGIFSYRVGAQKPSRKMFRAFEEKWGKPLIYADDRRELVEEARRYGWHAHLFRSAGELYAAIRTCQQAKCHGRTPLDLIRQVYPEDTPLRRLLLQHSFQVMDKALALLDGLPEEHRRLFSRSLVVQGALLHDVGIGECHAPSILCVGTAPYLTHGVRGAAILRSLDRDLEPVARICERHTGVGITAEDIRSRQLPLPERDYSPETPEERLICLADKFYSKSGDLQEKSVEEVIASMTKFGPVHEEKIRKLLQEFLP